MSSDYFFELILEFERFSKERQVTEAYVLNNIAVGLKNLFGEVGAAFPLDILKLEKVSSSSSNSFRIVLKGTAANAVKIRSSLSLQGFYQGDRCAYHVTRGTDNLLLLADQDPNFRLD